MVALPKTEKVEVVIECRDDRFGDHVSKRLKMGSEKVSDTQFKTFVHVSDADMFCDCLEWKYMAACKRWKAADADDSVCINAYMQICIYAHGHTVLIW